MFTDIGIIVGAIDVVVAEGAAGVKVVAVGTVWIDC